MNKWKTHSLRVFKSVVGLATVLGLLSLAPASTATATSVAPEVSVVSATSVVAIEVSTAADVLLAPAAKKAPVSNHCDKKARWKSTYNKKGKKLRTRIWYYNDKYLDRHFCFKIYKVKKSKTTIGLYIIRFDGENSHLYNKKASLWLHTVVVPGATTYVKSHHGKTKYNWFALDGYGTI